MLNYYKPNPNSDPDEFIDSDYSDLTEEELIEVLDKGGLSEKKFQMLLKAMETKGLKGMIMVIPDPDTEEGQAAVEYIEYHKKLPKSFPQVLEKDIKKSKEVLFNDKASLEEKKIALITLAHVGRVDVYKILEEYEKNPDSNLKIWINIAIQECQSFLKSDILNKPIIDISKVSKVGRNDLCPCGSGKKYKRCCG